MSDTKVEPESGKESRRKCRTHGRMHALVQDVSVWIHGHRLAVTLSCTFAGLNIAMWIGFALAGRPLPLRSLRTSLQEFNLLHLLATLLLTRGILQLLVDTIALLVMFAIAETLLGRRRTLTAAFICTLAGTALGLLLCGGIAQLLQGTPVVGRIRFALSPLTLGVGAMMAASTATMNTAHGTGCDCRRSISARDRSVTGMDGSGCLETSTVSTWSPTSSVASLLLVSSAMFASLAICSLLTSMHDNTG